MQNIVKKLLLLFLLRQCFHLAGNPRITFIIFCLLGPWHFPPSSSFFLAVLGIIPRLTEQALRRSPVISRGWGPLFPSWCLGVSSSWLRLWLSVWKEGREKCISISFHTPFLLVSRNRFDTFYIRVFLYLQTDSIPFRLNILFISMSQLNNCIHFRFDLLLDVMNPFKTRFFSCP